MDQLTIFDVMYQFDESKAKFKKCAAGYEYCDVVVLIPKDVLSPVEYWMKYGARREEEVKNREKWSAYVTAIWNYKSDRDWETACNMLEEYRDQEKPIAISVYTYTEFQPEHVIEYL